MYSDIVIIFCYVYKLDGVSPLIFSDATPPLYMATTFDPIMGLQIYYKHKANAHKLQFKIN